MKPDAILHDAACRCADCARVAPARGGAGRGQGRKPLAPGQESTTVNVRMTPAQRAKLDALGGASWIRDRIDHAKVKPPP